MQELLKIVQGILVRALPTFFLVILLHWYLKKILFQPMERVMEERRRQTDGVLEACEAALVRAQERTNDHERRLREAQAEIFEQQETERRKLAARQAEAVEEARKRAKERVAEARLAIRAEAENAKQALGEEAGQLADQITRIVLAGGAQ